MARPSDYSEEIATLICARLIVGESLREITRDETMPSSSAVYVWLLKHKEFAEQYTRAREVQADVIFDELLEIADDGTNDWMERKREDGSTEDQVNHEHIQRSRLRIDARKWMASKLAPKKYGDKLDVTSGGDKIGIGERMLRYRERADG